MIGGGDDANKRMYERDVASSLIAQVGLRKVHPKVWMSGTRMDSYKAIL